MSDKGPCYGCTERHPHCHTTCEAYADYSTALQVKKDEIRAIKIKGYIYTDYAKERYVKHRIGEIIAKKKREK